MSDTGETETESSGQQALPNAGVRNPLWIIALFISLTETAMVVGAVNLAGWEQAVVTVFSVLFPSAIMACFFWILVLRPYVLYAPHEYGSSTTVATFVEAMRGPSLNSEKSMSTLIAAAVDVILSRDEGEPYNSSQSERIESSERSQIIEMAKATAFETLAKSTITVLAGHAIGEAEDRAAGAYITVDEDTSFRDLLDLVAANLSAIALKPADYGQYWLLCTADGSEVFDRVTSQPLKEVGIKAPKTLSVRLIRHRRATAPSEATASPQDDLPHLKDDAELRRYIFQKRLTVSHLRAIMVSLGLDVPPRLTKARLIDEISVAIFGISLEIEVNRSLISDGGAGLIATVGAVEIAGWYRQHGPRLFGANVRQYLKKPQPEDSIVKVLNSQPQNFAMLNNGINIVASSVHRQTDPLSGRTRVALSRAKVVAGMSTIVTLASHEVGPGNDAKSAEVIVRIFEEDDVDSDIGQKGSQ